MSNLRLLGNIPFVVHLTLCYLFFLYPSLTLSFSLSLSHNSDLIVICRRSFKYCVTVSSSVNVMEDYFKIIYLKLNFSKVSLASHKKS